MNHFINAVLDAGLLISKTLQQNDDAFYHKHQVGAGGDVSIGADLCAEKIFISHLSSFGNIDSEESGFIDNNKTSTIIIDPLDGSDNFISKIPYFGASVALCENSQTKVGIVMNFCNKSVVINDGSVNLTGNLEMKFSEFKPLVLNNIPKCGIFERAYSNPEMCAKLKSEQIKFRSLGALALSLSLSCEVNFVLFSGEIRKYDVMAGFMIARDLYKLEHKNFVLISKDKRIFDKISKLLI